MFELLILLPVLCVAVIGVIFAIAMTDRYLPEDDDESQTNDFH